MLGPKTVLYEDRYQQIYRVAADFGAYEKEYFVRDSGTRAAVLLVRGGAEALLVRQYRFLINRLSWEVPGGKVDPGESPQQAAVRECLEETGFQCAAVTPLVFFHAGLDSSHNPTHVFLAEEFTDTGSARIDPREVHAREWVTLDRCLEMIRSGDIVDSLSVIAILGYGMLAGAAHA